MGYCVQRVREGGVRTRWHKAGARSSRNRHHSPVSRLAPLIVIAGPTATGKTSLAIRLAAWVREAGRAAEIVSADSRQVYRGLDIGTAKATAAERALIPHHGLDLVDPDEPFSVADFVAHAQTVLRRLGAGNGVAILAGGTGLYLRAVARGLDVGALPSDPTVRTALEEELAHEGLPALAARLAAIAPATAGRVDLKNPRRVVRALEIASLVGDADPPPARGYPAPVAWIGLDTDRERHRSWIESRARAQFDAGLVEEARALRERFDPALPAFSAIGYREAWDVIDGHATLDEAIERDIARNVAFARRQRTWFRAEPDITWLDAAADDLDGRARAVAEGILVAGQAAPLARTGGAESTDGVDAGS
jgi:tRNA dimethylallyltransferase